MLGRKNMKAGLYDLIVKKSDNPNFQPKAYWRSSKPFVENRMAVLIHRPYKVNSFKIDGRRPHIAITYHCGNTHCGGEGKLTFLDAPPSGSIVCQRCEDYAIERGLPSSKEITGFHVCLGGVKAVKNCCKEK